jgi:hypothetical protein
MSTSQIDVQNNPPPDDLKDVKPGLSPEELAALNDEPGDKPSGDEVAGGAAVAPDAETNQASPKPEDQPDAGAPSDDDAAAAAAAAEQGAPPADQLDQEDIPRGQHVSTEIQPSRQFAEDIGAAIGTVDEQITALETKMDANEITMREFMSQSRELNNSRQDLVADQREQAILQNANAALGEGDWNSSVAMYVSANPDFQNPIMMGAFDAALKELYKVPENIGSSHTWYLQTAGRTVREQITPAQAAADNPPDNAGTPQQQAQAAATAAGQNAAQAAAAARGKVPDTLGGAAGGANPAADDEFSAIDALEGIALEAALAKLTPDQERRYLESGVG